MCDKSDCTVCRMVHTGLCTPDDNIARYTLLRPMDRPVMDPVNAGHFVPASKTASFIANNKLNFGDLKKELPTIDKNKFQIAEDKMDRDADANAGGSELFKGTKVWDVVECNTCNFHRCIYSNYVLNSSKFELSGAQQKKLVEKLEAYKYSYVCGDACPVDHFEKNVS